MNSKRNGVYEMKIMHVLQSSHFSGAENVVCQIFNLFKDNKDVEMIYCCKDGTIRSALEERNIPFYALSKFSLSEIKKALHDIKPDIIHAHDMRASFMSARVCGSIPLVSHIHNNAFDSRGLSLKAFAYLFAGLKAKHIFWVSKSSYEGYCFHTLLKKKSTILYNIIDIDELYKRVENDHNTYDYDVIYLGRLTREKNPRRFLDVCKLLADKRPNIKIAIVGTGDMERETKKRAVELGLSTNISFLGYMQNPTKILKDSKVMIMTSLWEGTPMCALEAAALGTPIVSTPVDGLKVIVKNEVMGFLSDSNNQLVEVAIRIIENNQLRSSISNNEIEFSKEYNNKNDYKNKLYRAYKSIINK